MIDFRRPTVLFGGSFDPVHEGHLHVAREVMKKTPAIKQLVFMPAFQSPGKPKPQAGPEQRLEWLRLAAEPEGFLVWGREIQRKEDSFTVDSLEEAHRMGASAQELFLLLGADAYAAFPGWKNPERIRALCRLLIVGRPGFEEATQNPTDKFISIPPHPASSTTIRTRLATGNIPGEWLPAAVKAALEKILPIHNPYVRKLT